MAQMPKKIEMATKEPPRERIPSIRKPQIRRSVSFDYIQDSLTPEVRYSFLMSNLNGILGTYLWPNRPKTWSTFDGIPKDYETRKSADKKTAKTRKTCREKIIQITFFYIFYI